MLSSFTVGWHISLWKAPVRREEDTVKSEDKRRKSKHRIFENEFTTSPDHFISP